MEGIDGYYEKIQSSGIYRSIDWVKKKNLNVMMLFYILKLFRLLFRYISFRDTVLFYL